ncbi:MAG: PDZ domain-containing protein [Chthonomonadales bacterium]
MPLLALVARGPVLAQAKPIDTEIEFKTLPTVDLLCGLLAESAHANSFRRFTTDYSKLVADTIAPAKSGSSIQKLDALLSSGKSVKSLTIAAISVDLKLPTIASGLSEAEILEFKGALLEADKACNWSEFYTKKSPELSRDFLAKTKALVMDNFWLKDYLDYSGRSKAAFTVILAPLIGDISIPVATADGRDILLLGALDGDAARIKFDSEGFKRILRLLNECTLSPIFAKAESVTRTAAWFKTIRASMPMPGVTSWYEAVTREAAHAVSERGLASTRPSISVEGDTHLLMPFFLSRLKEYEADRIKYPTLKDLSGRLTSVLDDIELYQKGARPVDLGLSEVWLTDDGLPVRGLTPQSPADKAGIHKGDIVTSIGGVRINGSESYLKAWKIWKNATDGTTVKFGVKRGKTAFVVGIKSVQTGGEPTFRWKPGHGPK